MKKIFLSLFSFFFLFSPAFAETIIPVEDIFSDINKDYKYYKEVQELYNRGMIFPDENGKLNPEKLLARDEFVGISIEVICKKCIQPNTALDLLKIYTGKNIYFDISEKNKYFYCVAEADAKDYVRGYNPGDKCEDGTYKVGERPFCSNNTITREEAYAVILRNSKILTIEENEKILQEIKNGTITESLSQDVMAQNIDKTPYTFYGYFKKALEYELVEYDNLGNKKNYKLLEKKDNKIYPKKAVTKEEFIYMAYIALRANSCKEEVVKNDIALKMKIYDKSCTNSSQNCNLSNLKDSNNTYDFKALVETTCEKGVKDKEGYIWRFYNTSSGEKIIKYGSYIDNYSFLTNGTWEVYLRVIDNCGNTAEVFSTISIDNNKDKKENIAVKMEIYDKSCTNSLKNCKLSNLSDMKNTYDFKAIPETFCQKGIKEYKWDFRNTSSGEKIIKYGDYIDNYIFLKNGVWKVYLKVIDNCGNTAEVFSTLVINDKKDDTYNNFNVSIRANPINGKSPLLVNFASIVSGGDGKYEYTWDFGDGMKGYRKDVNHTFQNPGVYEVILTVKDTSGKVGKASVIINVSGDNKKNTNLNVSVDANPTNGYAPLLVNFGSIVSGGDGKYEYTWNFGDGTKGYGKNIDHIFQNPGVYEVILIVKDGSGKVGKASVFIHVLPKNCLNDSDKDGIGDCDDICPLVFGEEINKGCPVLLKKCDKNCACGTGYKCNLSDTNICPSQGICQPILNLNTGDCLYDSGKDTIIGNVACNTCPCSNFVDFISSIRKCDVLFPAITSPDSTEIYSRGKTYTVK